MSGGSQSIVVVPSDGQRFSPFDQTLNGLVCASSDRWLLRTSDGREIELLRREVTIAYRKTPAFSSRLWLAPAGWSLACMGVVSAVVAVVAAVITPPHSVAASATIDIPVAALVQAHVAPKVIVRTRYVPLPAATDKRLDVVMPGADAGPSPDVASALRRAFATNEAQEWADSSASGIVVVGGLQIERGHQCRDVAVLTRVLGGRDTTANNRYCQTGHGPIAVDAP